MAFIRLERKTCVIRVHLQFDRVAIVAMQNEISARNLGAYYVSSLTWFYLPGKAAESVIHRMLTK